MNSQIIFIVGPPRSGTTLVYGMLVKNQKKIGGTFKESQFYSSVLTQPYSRDTYFNNDYFKSLFTQSEIEQIFEKESSHLDFFKAAIKYYLNKENKYIFVEKSPIHMLYLRDIIKDFDQPFIICLKRNPAAVINSMVKTKWITLYNDRLPGRLKHVKLLRYFSAFAKYYQYSRKFKFIEKYNNSIFVNYEDIVLNRIDLKSIIESNVETKLEDFYIAPPYSAEVDHKRNELDKSRINGYKKSMPVFAQLMAKILFQSANKFNSIVSSLVCNLIFEPLYQLTRLKRNYWKSY